MDQAKLIKRAIYACTKSHYCVKVDPETGHQLRARRPNRPQHELVFGPRENYKGPDPAEISLVGNYHPKYVFIGIRYLSKKKVYVFWDPETDTYFRLGKFKFEDCMELVIWEPDKCHFVLDSEANSQVLSGVLGDKKGYWQPHKSKINIPNIPEIPIPAF